MPFTATECKEAAVRCRQYIAELEAQCQDEIVRVCPNAITLAERLITYWRHWADWYETLAGKGQEENDGNGASH